MFEDLFSTPDNNPLNDYLDYLLVNGDEDDSDENDEFDYDDENEDDIF